MSPRDPFSGDHQPANIDGDPDDVFTVVLGDEVGREDTDSVEPVLDE